MVFFMCGDLRKFNPETAYRVGSVTQGSVGGSVLVPDPFAGQVPKA